MDCLEESAREPVAGGETDSGAGLWLVVRPELLLAVGFDVADEIFAGSPVGNQTRCARAWLATAKVKTPTAISRTVCLWMSSGMRVLIASGMTVAVTRTVGIDRGVIGKTDPMRLIGVKRMPYPTVAFTRTSSARTPHLAGRD